MRFQQRRKSGEEVVSRSPKLPKFASRDRPSCNNSPVSKEDYKKHVAEMAEEGKKTKPNYQHLNLLLKETHANRRAWLSTQPAGSWSPLLKTFPFFKEIDQIVYEYCLLQNREELSKEGKNMEQLFRIVAKNMDKKPQGTDTMKEMQLIQHLEKATAFDKGKGKKTEPILTIKKDISEADIETNCTSKELTAPRIVCFLMDDNMSEAVIIGDGQMIYCKTDSLLKALLYVVLVYYVTDLDFPRQYSQLLGIIQQYVVKENFLAAVSGKYVKMCHTIDRELEKL